MLFTCVYLLTGTTLTELGPPVGFFIILLNGFKQKFLYGEMKTNVESELKQGNHVILIMMYSPIAPVSTWKKTVTIARTTGPAESRGMRA
jgi:hypothetical protein